MTGQWRHETPVVEPTTVPEYYPDGLVTGDGAINTSQVYHYTAFGAPSSALWLS